MKKIKRFLRILVFVLMIFLSFAGVGLPLKVMERDKESFHKEQKDEKDDEEQESKELE